jgi:hypothetical protein
LPDTIDAEGDTVTISIPSLPANCFNYLASNRTLIMAPNFLCPPATYPTIIIIKDGMLNTKFYSISIVVQAAVATPALPADPIPTPPADPTS